MWVMASSPLIVATDLRNMSLIQQTILFNEEMFAVHQDPLATAGGRVGTWECGEVAAVFPVCQIWTRPLGELTGDAHVLI